MADLSNVIKVTQAQYDTLLSGGSVSGHTFDANAIYFIEDGEWYSTTVTSSGFRSLTGLETGGTYMFEVRYYFNSAWQSFTCFPFVYLNTGASASTTPVEASSLSRYSSATTARNAVIALYHSGTTWYIQAYYGTSLTSLTAQSQYIVRYRRVNV